MGLPDPFWSVRSTWFAPGYAMPKAAFSLAFSYGGFEIRQTLPGEMLPHPVI